MATKSAPTTPYELWNCNKHALEGLYPWGSAGYVYPSSHKYGKLNPRANKCLFIKYCEYSKGYVMWIL